MRRARFWIIVSSAALVVLVAAVLIALPYALRAIVVSQVRGLTGREVSIERVNLNLFTRRLRVSSFRLADREGPAPFIEFKRLEARFRILPLLRGTLHVDELDYVGPRVRVVRLASGELNFADIAARSAGGPPSKEPARLTLGRLALTDGHVTFEDRMLAPTRVFEVGGLAIELRDISTVTDAANGTASVDCTLAGAPVTLRATGIRGHPARAHAVLDVKGLDLAQLWPYVPPDAAMRPGGGRFTTRLDVQYDATAGARAGGDVTITDLALIKRGETDPMVTTPELRLTSKDIVYKDGAVTAARLEVLGDCTVVDSTLSPPRRYDLKAVHLTVEDASYPTRGPARLALTAGLPAGGALEVKGTTTLAPISANLEVVLKAIDLALATPYVPPTSPVTVDRGRLDAALTVGYGEDTTVRVSGDLTAADMVLLRKGQKEPFVRHPAFRIAIKDFALKDGAMSVVRLAVSDRPTIVDASVSPPQRVEFTKLAMVAEDATWPAERAARVKVEMAIAGSGNGLIQGTFNAATLGADIKATVADVDLTRVLPYLPPDTPVVLGRGRLASTLNFKHDRTAGIRLSGDGAVTDLAVSRRGESEPLVTDPRVTFAIGDLTAKLDTIAVAARSLTITGTPTLADTSVSPPRRIPLRGFKLSVADARWPGKQLARLALDVDLPEAGTVRIAGTAAPEARKVDATIDVADATLAPYRSFLPITGPLGGRLDAGLTLAAAFADTLSLAVTGKAAARSITLGPPDRQPVTAESVDLTGVDVRWPQKVRIDRVALVKPYALIERARDGSFPLRALLAPPESGPAPAPKPAAPPAKPAPAEKPGPAAEPGPPLAVEIGEVVIDGGNLRFLDQSTTPFYSEEISGLAVTVRNITTAKDGRADIAVQGVVGANGALDLKGQVAPLADPFFLELAGELREFPLARTNPYFRQFFDWALQRGSLTTKVHYRIVGDQLEAENHVRVQRLGVQKDTTGGDADKKIGLPLGMIVAVVTDSRGNIEFDLPVQGKLGSPGFSLGGAIMAALKNVLVNLVTGPFRAIGKLFGGGESVEELKVDPVTFEPGSSAISADADKHLQHVADFLRGSPNVALALRPVVTAGDVANLKLAEVTTRIQRVQREQKLADFPAAAAVVFKQTFPNRPVPKTSDEMVEALRDHEPAPEEAARRLATSRVEITREALVERAGVERSRLHASEETPPPGPPGGPPTPTGPAAGPTGPAAGPADTGKGRVEFELKS